MITQTLHTALTREKFLPSPKRPKKNKKISMILVWKGRVDVSISIVIHLCYRQRTYLARSRYFFSIFAHFISIFSSKSNLAVLSYIRENASHWFRSLFTTWQKVTVNEFFTCHILEYNIKFQKNLLFPAVLLDTSNFINNYQNNMFIVILSSKRLTFVLSSVFEIKCKSLFLNLQKNKKKSSLIKTMYNISTTVNL